MSKTKTEKVKPVKKIVNFFDGDLKFLVPSSILLTEIESIDAQIKASNNSGEEARLLKQKEQLKTQLRKYEKFAENPSGNDTLSLEEPFNAELIYHSKEEDLSHKAKKSAISFMIVHSSPNSLTETASIPPGKKILLSTVKSGGTEKSVASDELLEKCIRQTEDGGTVVFSSCYAELVIQNIKPHVLEDIKKRKIKVVIAGDGENPLSILSAVVKIHDKIIKDNPEKPEEVFSKYSAETYSFFNHEEGKWEKRKAIEFNKEEGLHFFRQKFYFTEGEWQENGKEDVTDKVNDTSTGLANHLLHLPVVKQYDREKTRDFLQTLKHLYNECDGLPKVSRHRETYTILNYAITQMDRHENHLAEAIIDIFDKEQIKKSINSIDRKSTALFLSIVNLLRNEKTESYESITKALQRKFDCDNWTEIAEKTVRLNILMSLSMSDDYPLDTILTLGQTGFFEDSNPQEIRLITEFLKINKTPYFNLKSTLIKLCYHKKQGIGHLNKFDTLDEVENHPIARAIDSFDDDVNVQDFESFMDHLGDYVSKIFPGESLSSLMNQDVRLKLTRYAFLKGKKSFYLHLLDGSDFLAGISEERKNEFFSAMLPTAQKPNVDVNKARETPPIDQKPSETDRFLDGGNAVFPSSRDNQIEMTRLFMERVEQFTEQHTTRNEDGNIVFLSEDQENASTVELHTPRKGCVKRLIIEPFWALYRKLLNINPTHTQTTQQSFERLAGSALNSSTSSISRGEAKRKNTGVAHKTKSMALNS